MIAIHTRFQLSRLCSFAEIVFDLLNLISGRIRDLPYVGEIRKRRSLGTPDAIMFAAAGDLQQQWSVKLSAIHFLISKAAEITWS